MSKSAPAYVDDYQVSQDVHHLTQAAAIKKDPKRHKAAQAHARKKMDELKSATAIDTDKDGK